MPENSVANKKPPLLLITIIVIALAFVLGLFAYMNQNKPDIQPQSQPNVEATNSADFNQADRLEATGATLITIDKPAVTIYARTTCTHCQNVDAFLKKNPQYQSQVTKKYLDDMINGTTYTQEFMQAAVDCGLDINAIGVPFLYFGADSTRAKADRCLMGDTPIISYFENSTK